MKTRMKTLQATAWLAAVLVALSAQAHQPDIPADIPPEYTSECGGCHVAYLPALLPESEWQDIMRQLDKHYGSDAGLGEETRKRIEDFLTQNAGSRWKLLFGAGDPPRLTSTQWWRIHHHELPDDIWNDKRVGSRSNCAACHPKAEKGLFDKKDLTKTPSDHGFTGERPPASLP